VNHEPKPGGKASENNQLLLELFPGVGFHGGMSSPQAQVIAIPTAFQASSTAVQRTAEPVAKSRLDIPTLGVALAVYVGFILSTWYFQRMPLLVAAPLLALLLTWYGSLQHETIHGHPTASRRLNAMLAGLPLSLWLPYGSYRATHLQHHRHGGRHLTDVSRDPESFYIQSGRFSRAGPLGRALRLANCMLAGRLILGPAIATAKFWESEARLVWSGDRRRVGIWTRHALAVSLVLLWTVGVCHIPFWVYALLVVYPSISLGQLRSFVEHRADAELQRRTVAVEGGPLWALIFLNNNLHIAHHAHPKLPWYELPRVWREMRGPAIGCGLVFQGGYHQVFKEYLFRPVINVEHPATSGVES
jgi:fatty acid desaturase